MAYAVFTIPQSPDAGSLSPMLDFTDPINKGFERFLQ